MRIATGKVVSGKVVVEGEPLEEGATVTVLAPDSQEPFEIAEELDAALLDSIEEAERGATIAGAALLRELRSRS
jgi:hypothetical protein